MENGLLQVRQNTQRKRSRGTENRSFSILHISISNFGMIVLTTIWTYGQSYESAVKRAWKVCYLNGLLKRWLHYSEPTLFRGFSSCSSPWPKWSDWWRGTRLPHWQVLLLRSIEFDGWQSGRRFSCCSLSTVDTSVVVGDTITYQIRIQSVF